MSEEFNPDILTVTDEDGTEHSFELLDDLEHEGVHYLAVVPFTPDESILDEDLDLIIMKVSKDGEDDYLDIVQDDDEFYEVGDIFAQRLAEMYEIDVEEGE